MIEWVVLSGLLVLIGLAFAILGRMRMDAASRDELVRLRVRAEDYAAATAERDEQLRVIQQLQEERGRLSAELENERRSTAEKLALLQQAEARLKMEFENLAGRIFDDRGQLLREQHREQLGGIVQPLKEQLDAFRHRVDELHKQGAEQSTLLLEQVRQLQELSGKVSEEANQLAHAIKGDSKTQGDWGEVIVERIFEASGLSKGREYRIQTAIRDADGQIKRPDFIVDLPGDKSVIIDSKVSLTAYERYASANEEADRVASMAEHVRSVRRHVEQLKDKDYTELMGNRTLDFVIMCIPLEAAYQAAMQADPELIYDVARTSVVITGPNTLMITLKLIAQIWRREHENRNAEKIAERAGKLYDQVVLIADGLLDAQKKLEGTTESFDKVMRRLREGRGNLLGRVEELRKLGAKVSKSMPMNAVPESEEEEAVSLPDRDRIDP